jgi:hypothetical protein
METQLKEIWGGAVDELKAIRLKNAITRIGYIVVFVGLAVLLWKLLRP